MKKVVILLGHAVVYPFNETGGVEKVMLNVWRHLKKSCSSEIQYIMISRGEKKSISEKTSYSKSQLVLIDGYDWTKSRYINLLNMLRWLMKNKKILSDSDYVIYNNPFGPIYSYLTNYKGFVALVDQRGTGNLRFFQKSIFIDRLYCISEYVAGKWGDEYTKKIKIINNCFDESIFSHSLKKRKRTSICFIGRVAKEKGLHVLLEAISLLADKGVEINLIVIGPNSYESGGDEEYYKECCDFIERKKINDKIIFLGEKKSDEINSCLSEVNALVVPSIWDEAFGIVIVEALAVGCPVIGFKKGAIPEIIKDRYNGLVVNEISGKKLANNIELLCFMSDAEYLQVTKNAIISSKEYSSENIAKKYCDDIVEILEA